MNTNFTIRVYGLLVQNNSLLVVDELIAGKQITKFPGGGLEFGEGTRDCLRREMKEETGLEVIVEEHFYTTDFFQQSAFHLRPMQVVSIYYKLSLPANPDLSQMAALDENDTIIGFRWLPLNELSPIQLSMPIDRVVVEMLLTS